MESPSGYFLDPVAKAKEVTISGESRKFGSSVVPFGWSGVPFRLSRSSLFACSPVGSRFIVRARTTSPLLLAMSTSLFSVQRPSQVPVSQFVCEFGSLRGFLKWTVSPKLQSGDEYSLSQRRQ